MKKLLFLALLGCNFANAQFKVGVYGNPNLTSVYANTKDYIDFYGSTLEMYNVKSGYGYGIGASLIYEVNNTIDVSVELEHSKKTFSTSPIRSNFWRNEDLKSEFTQFTPSVNARYKHKFFYVSAGIGYGMTSNNYYNSQNTINLKASIGHQIKITEKSKINVFLSDEYMTKGYSTMLNNSSFNTIGLGIGFETYL